MNASFRYAVSGKILAHDDCFIEALAAGTAADNYVLKKSFLVKLDGFIEPRLKSGRRKPGFFNRIAGNSCHICLMYLVRQPVRHDKNSRDNYNQRQQKDEQ